MLSRQEYSSLRQGLVGAWCPSLGATSLSLIDRSGRNNHGTLANMGGQDNWRANGSGVALTLDGTNDFILGTTSNGFPTGSAARSMSVWFRMSANANAEFLGYGGNSASGCRFALFRDTSLGIGMEISNSWATAAWTYDTAWHHLATSYDASATNVTACRVFLDGVQLSVGTSSPATVINTVNTPVTIGAISGATTLYLLNGQIDDARIYSRPLTFAEIRLLASRRGIGLSPLPDRAAGMPRKLFVNVGGTWRNGDAYVNTGSGWRLGIPYVNAGGTWK